MLSLGRNGYTATQVQDALLASHRKFRFAFERLDKNNAPLGWYDGVTDATVNYNSLAQVRRTMRFTIRDTSTVDWFSDRIRPHVYLEMPDGGEADFPQGILLMATPSRAIQDGTLVPVREVEAYDQSLVLRDDRVSSRYTVTSGTNYITAVKDVLDSAGITLQNLTPTSNTLPVTRDWNVGTPKATIVNDLLTAINYESLYFDADGYAVAKPYTSPADRGSEFTYTTDSKSVVFPQAEYEYDLFEVPNQWVLVVSQPDRPVLSTTYTNVSNSSPTSTGARGRVITDFRDQEDAADQAALDARAERLAVEASQVYEAVDFETGLMPIHEHADVMTLNYPELGVNAKFSEHKWSMPLQTGAKMKHRIRRVVNV